MKQDTHAEIKVIPSDKAYRIRVAIALTGLKTPEFSRKSGISRATLWTWENAKAPLSHKSAIRLSEILNSFNVECSPHWLLAGQGNPPQIRSHSQPSPQDAFKINDAQISVLKETEFFRSLSQNHIILGVRDDSMNPFYNNGDYVGGINIPLSEIKRAYNQNCIVSLKGGVSFIRKLSKGTTKNQFNLYALNMQSTAKNLVLLDTEIESAAVIVWHRTHFDR